MYLCTWRYGRVCASVYGSVLSGMLMCTPARVSSSSDLGPRVHQRARQYNRARYGTPRACWLIASEVTDPPGLFILESILNVHLLHFHLTCNINATTAVILCIVFVGSQLRSVLQCFSMPRYGHAMRQWQGCAPGVHPLRETFCTELICM